MNWCVFGYTKLTTRCTRTARRRSGDREERPAPAEQLLYEDRSAVQLGDLRRHAHVALGGSTRERLADIAKVGGVTPQLSSKLLPSDPTIFQLRSHAGSTDSVPVRVLFRALVREPTSGMHVLSVHWNDQFAL